jgi:hypothetical protein
MKGFLICSCLFTWLLLLFEREVCFGYNLVLAIGALYSLFKLFHENFIFFLDVPLD